jgi:hypothetical protein
MSRCLPPANSSSRCAWCRRKFVGGCPADNFVVLLQFSTKGQRTWANGKYAVLNRFRLLTDEIAEKADMNVAFSPHDTQPPERWDQYACPTCGQFEFRHRTRKLRSVAPLS